MLIKLIDGLLMYFEIICWLDDDCFCMTNAIIVFLFQCSIMTIFISFIVNQHFFFFLVTYSFLLIVTLSYKNIPIIPI